MCWKCQEIDKVIFHYRTMLARVSDEQTERGLEELIRKLDDEKKSLHSEQQE